MNETPLNYHHLRLFWEVARGGSLRVAAEKLNLSQPTISAQIKNLEEALNKPLFFRNGRGLKLTPAGLLTMEFSSQIFALGTEISRTVQGHGKSANSRLRIGVTDTMPKLVAWRFIRPAMRRLPDLQLYCSEGTTQEMLGLLAAGKLDAVLSDEASPSRMPMKAYNHMLGKSPVVFCATSSLAKRLRKTFPASLNTAAALLPANRSAWRHQIDRWFEAHSIRPQILAEFDDAALMKTAAADGIGFVPVVATVLDEAKKRYGLLPIQQTMGCDCLFYLIAMAHATHHPALQAIIQESGGYLSNQTDHIF